MTKQRPSKQCATCGEPAGYRTFWRTRRMVDRGYEPVAVERAPRAGRFCLDHATARAEYWNDRIATPKEEA